ncbi:MAG: hypothetical protein RL277_1792 [Planctomycetota bacterium]|jgi:hypothetical protein
MSSGLKLMLLLGCAMLVLLEAPRCGLVVLEDLGGPYPQLEPGLESAALESQTEPMEVTQPEAETTKR